MWTCPISPQNLREVQDSSRYFSLKIASDINSGEGTLHLHLLLYLFFYFFIIIILNMFVRTQKYVWASRSTPRTTARPSSPNCTRASIDRLVCVADTGALWRDLRWSVIQKVNAVKELRNEEEMQKKYGDMKLTDDDDDEDESAFPFDTTQHETRIKIFYLFI
jgi:hypothetical protein